MANFDTLLSNLHGNSSIISNTSADLIVSPKRQFSVVDGFDTVIGYEGDVNSQIIVIELPEAHAGHKLSLCARKELKWKNLSNSAEGTSTLVAKDGSSTLYEWEVPADIMAAAGTIEIYISFYDTVVIDSNTQIAFAWNTASYSGLSIGKTMSSVGSYLPARDEILLIDEETRNIIAPPGYNNTICNYGDLGMSEVYFIINRYLGKNHSLDVLNENTTPSIFVSINGKKGIDSNSDNITKELYSVDLSNIDNEGMVLLKWKVPPGVTGGVGPGKLQIAVHIYNNNNTTRWTSNAYNDLQIGHSVFEYQGEEAPEEWNLTTDYAKEIIEDYFEEGTIIFDAN